MHPQNIPHFLRGLAKICEAGPSQLAQRVHLPWAAGVLPLLPFSDPVAALTDCALHKGFSALRPATFRWAAAAQVARRTAPFIFRGFPSRGLLGRGGPARDNLLCQVLPVRVAVASSVRWRVPFVFRRFAAPRVALLAPGPPRPRFRG